MVITITWDHVIDYHTPDQHTLLISSIGGGLTLSIELYDDDELSLWRSALIRRPVSVCPRVDDKSSDCKSSQMRLKRREGPESTTALWVPYNNNSYYKTSNEPISLKRIVPGQTPSPGKIYLLFNTLIQWHTDTHTFTQTQSSTMFLYESICTLHSSTKS